MMRRMTWWIASALGLASLAIVCALVGGDVRRAIRPRDGAKRLTYTDTTDGRSRTAHGSLPLDAVAEDIAEAEAQARTNGGRAVDLLPDYWKWNR